MNILKIEDDSFNDIYSDIKGRYLSSTNFPKLIVGTGLSVIMGISGMSGLSEKLDIEFNNEENSKLKELWNSCKYTVNKNGLEAALLEVQPDELFVDKIRKVTADLILRSDYDAREYVLSSHTGFEKLLKYLSDTVSVNNSIIDIMTPNYDLVIETIADKINLKTTLGFEGNIYQSFNSEILNNPYSYFKKENRALLRIFKPHGSINWINIDGKVKQLNDYSHLISHSDLIEIIAPGRFKFEYGLTHNLFRYHRETFNSLISSKEKYSLFIYGYGFNDQHFDTVFENTDKDVIVLSRDVKKDVVDRALNNTNWTIFYKNILNQEDVVEDGSYMIYRGKKYSINCDLWDIDNFSNVFIS